MSIILILISALSANVLAAAEESEVLVLTDSNIKEAISTHKNILVEFYAPWCGHCKRLAPEYERAAKALKLINSPAKLAKVDATVEKSSASQYQIKSYPTLLYFEDGKMVEKYPGARTAEGLAEYLRGKTGDL